MPEDAALTPESARTRLQEEVEAQFAALGAAHARELKRVRRTAEAEAEARWAEKLPALVESAKVAADERLRAQVALEREALAAERAHLHGELESTRQQLEALRDALAAAATARRYAESALLDARSALADERPLEAARDDPPDNPPAYEAPAHTRPQPESPHLHPQQEIAERLLASIRTMDAARSLSDTLSMLIDAAALEAPRLVLFVDNGSGMQGWKGVGFDTAVTSLQVSPQDEGLLGESLRRREPVLADREDGPAPPTFARLPPDGAALAVPLLVGSQPVALLYADHSADHGGGVAGRPTAWREAVQILGRHASATLARLTAARTAELLRRSLPSGAV